MTTAANVVRCNNGRCQRPVYRGKECFICWAGTKWDSMKQRIEHKHGRNLSYAGISLNFDRRKFVAWAINNPPPLEMQYPSIDRIEASKGYTFGNIRWLEHSINSRGNQRDIPKGFWKCNKCKRILELNTSNFRRNRTTKSGFQTYCKPCHNSYANSSKY